MLLPKYYLQNETFQTGDKEIKGRSDLTRNDDLWSGLEQNLMSNDSNNL